MDPKRNLADYFTTRKKAPPSASAGARTKKVEDGPPPAFPTSSLLSETRTRVIDVRSTSASRTRAAKNVTKHVAFGETTTTTASSAGPARESSASSSARLRSGLPPKTILKPPPKPPQKSKELKSMTLVEFQKMRQRAGASAIQDFRSKCEDLLKTPEELRKSPFYSPHKIHLSTTEVANNMRTKSARRQLFASSVTRLFPSTNEPEAAERSPSDREEDSFPSGVPQTATDGPISEVSGLVVEPPLSSFSSFRTPKKDAILTDIRSPGTKMSLFSPGKGHLYSYVKTAADVHAEAISNRTPNTADVKGPAAREIREVEMGGKRKAEYEKETVKKRLDQLRENKQKAELAAQKRVGILHGITQFSGSIPASERYADLIKPPAKEAIPDLPVKFQEMQDIFQRVDTGLTIASNRSESCCFERLRNTLLAGRKTRLTYADMGHIMAIFPEAYAVQVHKPGSERDCPHFKSNQRFGSQEHYVLFIRDDQNVSEKSEELLVSAKLSPFDRVRRQKKFRESLYNYVYDRHRDFLATLDPPQFLEDHKRITHWHARFPVEELDLPGPVALPEFSEPVAPRTCEEVLKIAGTIIRSRPLFGGKKGVTSPFKSPAKPVIDEKIFDHPAFKNVDEATKERVRASEAKRMMNYVVRDPKNEKRKRLLERMVQLGRILLGHFSSPVRHVLEEDDIIQTMKRSVGNALTNEELQDHYDLFIEIFSAAKWLERILCGRTWHVRKIDDNFGIIQMESVVELEYRRLEALVP